MCKYKRFSTALNGGAVVQAVHQFEDNQQSRTLIYSVGGKIFKDTGTQTDISTGVTVDTADDAQIHFQNYDAKLIGTDGQNSPFLYESLTDGAGIVMTERDSSVPATAKYVKAFREHIFFAYIRDQGDSVAYPYRIVHSDAGDPLRGYGVTNNDLNRNQAITGLIDFHDSLIVGQQYSMWYATQETFGSGQATPFVYRELSSRVGLVSQNAQVNTERGLFFADRKGIFFIQAGSPTSPLYISKGIETFWGELNQNRLDQIVACELPELNGVLFCVPHGSSQVRNNRGIFINYEQWSQDADGDAHPAFSIFKGGNTAFAFRSLSTVIDSGRFRAIGGTYDGFVSTLDQGRQDWTAGIGGKIKTPFYDAGMRSREKLWYNVVLDIDLDTAKALTVIGRYYNDPYPTSSSLSAGTSSDPLGSFILGQSALGTTDLGRIVGDLDGRSRYLSLEMLLPENTVGFELHGIILYYKTAGAWG